MTRFQWSGHAGEQGVPLGVILVAISARTGEVLIEHSQLPHARDLEPLPTVRRTATAVAADLIREDLFDAAADAVIVRLNDARMTAFVDELDEALFTYRGEKLQIH